MRTLLSISAVALISSSSINAEASVKTCAQELLDHPGARCALKQDLKLTRQQAHKIKTINKQNKRAKASLKLRLKRVRATMRSMRKAAISPMQLRRLRQQHAWLTNQLKKANSRALARVARVLTPRQRRQCENTYVASGHVRVKKMHRTYRMAVPPAVALRAPYPRFSSTVTWAPKQPQPKVVVPYYPPKVRRAPPSSTKVQPQRVPTRAQIIVSYPTHVDRKAPCTVGYGKSDC